MRQFTIASIAFVALAACASAPQQRQFGPDGRPMPARYTITAGDSDQISYRMLDGLNSLRAAAGVPPVRLSAELTAAAATHARDMSVQNRPWHFGSDGSSPVERARRAGFVGPVTGEVISETFETETETLAAWMSQQDTRAVLLDSAAGQMGFQWHQESTGKIWWVLVLGGS